MFTRWRIPQLPKLPRWFKIALIGAIYCLGFGYTREYIINTRWCNNDAKTYNYDECRESVYTTARARATFWPIYWTGYLGAYFAPKDTIYKKDEWNVGPEPDADEKEDNEKNSCPVEKKPEEEKKDESNENHNP